MNLSYRFLHVVIILLVLLAFGFAIFYLEGVLYLDPCPLCMVDRMILALIAAVSLIALLLGLKRWAMWFTTVAQVGLSFLGMTVAARHIYLQNLPRDQVPECGPDLFFMLEAFPMHQVIETVLSGSGQCADISWRFLGLTIPAQTLLLFLILLLLSVWALRSGRAHVR